MGLTVVSVFNVTIIRQTRIEIRHQGCNVLCRGQPAVNVFAGVQEATGGDGDIAHFVTVEREVEFQLDRLRTRMIFLMQLLYPCVVTSFQDCCKL